MKSITTSRLYNWICKDKLLDFLELNAANQTNTNINKMLYIDYINTQFSIYPFVQLPLFPK